MFDCILRFNPRDYFEGHRATIPETCEECAEAYKMQYNDVRRRMAPPSMDHARQRRCGEAVAVTPNNPMYPGNCPGKILR